MIPIPVFLVPLADCLNTFIDCLNFEDATTENHDTNWAIMLSLINIIISIANVLQLYFSISMESEILDAHKIITFLLGYRY